jgi:hypothetical protein
MCLGFSHSQSAVFQLFGLGDVNSGQGVLARTSNTYISSQALQCPCFKKSLVLEEGFKQL